MEAVVVGATVAEVERRRRLGIDHKDELWDGEWHLVNPPKLWHARLATDLIAVLFPLARNRGLVPYAGDAGIFGADPARNWRVPDQVYARPDQETEDGLTGAELVCEFRSPGDDSYAKLAFYAARGVTENLIVHRDRRFELRRLAGASRYALVPDGTSAALGVTLSTVDGPRLRITWEGGSAEV